MSEEISEILARIALVALVLSFFADLVLRAAWNKIYFKIGLPIFLKRIPVATIHEGLPYQYLLEDEFQAGLLTPLTFKKLDSHTYGFREAYFHFPSIRYFPIMHGLLIFEKDRRQVIVKGFASWFSIWLIFYFSLVWISLLSTFPLQITGSVAFLFLVLGVCYAIQCSRFSKVGAVAAQMWSQKHFTRVVGA